MENGTTNVKYVKDYVEEVHAKFPHLTQAEIKKVMIYGLQSLYRLNNYGGDVIIKLTRNKQSPYKGVIYFGKLYSNFLLFLKYSQFKYRIKYRVLDARRPNNRDNCYYFGLTDEDYRFYVSQKDDKVKIFENLYLYYVLDEAKLFNKATHFFKIQMPEFKGYFFRLENFESSEVEEII